MATPDYPRARWYGAYSGNYSRANRPSSNRINKIVVHCVQGSWSSAINWFRDPRAGVSAHYTVRSSDGFIGQSVQEKDIAYHAGNWPVNQTAIGIEHEGYGSQPARWFTPAMYNSSARLAAYLCRKYGIPVRRAANASEAGILAHRQTTSTACPGQWDFNRYMRLVSYYFNNAAAQKYSIIVDNSSVKRFATIGDWATSSFHGDQSFGPNYVYTEPADIAHYAYYKIKIPRNGQYHVYAWYPADPGYNNAAIYWIRTAGGWINRVVNQQVNGKRWVHLGTYNMRVGDGWYMFVSRRSAGGTGFVIADAVAVVER